MHSSRASSMLAVVSLAATLATSGEAQPSPPRVRLTEDLRLDATKEDFPTVGRFYVGPRREMVVPISQDAHARIFDSTGRRVATVGRRGSGPGEFQAINDVGWVADTIWMYDARQHRLSYFRRDGTHLRSDLVPTDIVDPPPLATGVRSKVQRYYPIAIGGDGSMIADATAYSASDPEPTGWGERFIIQLNAARAARLIVRPPSFYDERWFMEASRFGQQVPFTLFPQQSTANDGSRLATLIVDRLAREGGTFTVTLLRLSGDTVFSRAYPYRGVPITQRAVDSAIAAFLPAPGAGREGPADLPQQWQAVARRKMPPVYAPVQSILVGLDNTVWVGLRDEPAGQITLILNGRGDPIGSVHTPPRTRIRRASATHVWVTETDEDGLSSILRYRVSGFVCGPECR